MCFFPSFSSRPRGEVFWSTDWGRLLDAALRQGDPERFKTLGAAMAGKMFVGYPKSLEACKFIRLQVAIFSLNGSIFCWTGETFEIFWDVILSQLLHHNHVMTCITWWHRTKRSSFFIRESLGFTKEIGKFRWHRNVFIPQCHGPYSDKTVHAGPISQLNNGWNMMNLFVHVACDQIGFKISNTLNKKASTTQWVERQCAEYAQLTLATMAFAYRDQRSKPLGKIKDTHGLTWLASFSLHPLATAKKTYWELQIFHLPVGTGTIAVT